MLSAYPAFHQRGVQRDPCDLRLFPFHKSIRQQTTRSRPCPHHCSRQPIVLTTPRSSLLESGLRIVSLISPLDCVPFLISAQLRARTAFLRTGRAPTPLSLPCYEFNRTLASDVALLSGQGGFAQPSISLARGSLAFHDPVDVESRFVDSATLALWSRNGIHLPTQAGTSDSLRMI